MTIIDELREETGFNITSHIDYGLCVNEGYVSEWVIAGKKYRTMVPAEPDMTAARRLELEIAQLPRRRDKETRRRAAKMRYARYKSKQPQRKP
jgi:hypothetical protein